MYLGMERDIIASEYHRIDTEKTAGNELNGQIFQRFRIVSFREEDTAFVCLGFGDLIQHCIAVKPYRDNAVCPGAAAMESFYCLYTTCFITGNGEGGSCFAVSYIGSFKIYILTSSNYQIQKAILATESINS